MLLYAMVCGTVPFKATNMKELHIIIKKGEFAFSHNISESKTECFSRLIYKLDAKSLIKGLLQIHPEERLSIPEILNHPWMKESDSIDGCEEDSDSAEEFWVGLEDCMNNIGMTGLDPANINNPNILNLFFEKKPATKLKFNDYCYINNDFYTQHIGSLCFRMIINVNR